MKTIISGVYVITNSVNGHRYIGSSSNVSHRERIHFVYLRKGNHHNSHLQNAYSKYGRENFSFQVLEYCDVSLLIEREQYYIDSLRPEYNVRLTADSNLGLRRSKETRKKMSDAKIGFIPWNKGIPQSEETRRKNSEAHKGKKKSKETLRKLSEAGKRRHQTEETRRKVSEYHKGKIVSEETRQKISASHKARSLLKRLLQKISET
jgi:group I intron endonuclease